MKQFTIIAGHQTRRECISAGVDIWAAHGRQAVTARAVGAAVGLSGARVHQLFAPFGGMESLRKACEDLAQAVGNKSVLAQIAAGG